MKSEQVPSDSPHVRVDDLDPPTSRMLVEVDGRLGEHVSAAIVTVAQEENFVVGVVEWGCAELWNSIVHVDFETPRENPQLLLIWSALGDDVVHVVPCLASTRWRRVKLRIPPAWGIEARGVLVEVDANTWRATLTFTDDETTWAAEVPASFRDTSVGDVLAEMCACFWLRSRSAPVECPSSPVMARR